MKSAGLAALWLGVLAFLVWCYASSGVPRLDGQEVGRAVSVRGKVEIRPEQVALWSAVEEGAPLYDGSIVSTARDARADLRLLSGKVLQLGGNTQVSLSSGSGALRSDFEVNVLAGNLKVKADSAPQALLVRNFTSLGLRALGSKASDTRIRIGGKVIDLPLAEALASTSAESDETPSLFDFSLSDDKKVEVKSTAGTAVVLRDEATGDEQTIRAALTPEPQETIATPSSEAIAVDAQPEPTPTINTEWADERLVSEAVSKATLPAEFLDQVLWHSASVRQGRVEALDLPFALPALLGSTEAALQKKTFLLRVRSKATGREIMKRAKLLKVARGNTVRFVLEGADFTRLLQGATPSGARDGVHPFALALGIEGEQKPIWEQVERTLTIASAVDFAFSRMRVYVKEQAWSGVRPYFDGVRATVSPHWFWQGKVTSVFTRVPPEINSGGWLLAFEFADARLGPRFVSLLKNGAEFHVEPAGAARADGRVALRFVSAGQPRLVLAGRENVLVKESKRSLLAALSDWVDADAAWLGREGDVLAPKAFLPRLDALLSGGAWSGPFHAGTTGFRALLPGRAAPVFIEWNVAAKHPDFTRAFLTHATLFLSEKAPLRWHSRDAAEGDRAP